MCRAVYLYVYIFLFSSSFLSSVPPGCIHLLASRSAALDTTEFLSWDVRYFPTIGKLRLIASPATEQFNEVQSITSTQESIERSQPYHDEIAVSNRTSTRPSFPCLRRSSPIHISISVLPPSRIDLHLGQAVVKSKLSLSQSSRSVFALKPVPGRTHLHVLSFCSKASLVGAGWSGYERL